jgi:hypothetical protein
MEERLEQIRTRGNKTMSQTKRKRARMNQKQTTMHHAHTDQQLGDDLTAIMNHEYVARRKEDPTGAGALWGLKQHHYDYGDFRNFLLKALEDENAPADLRMQITAFMKRVEAKRAKDVAPRTEARSREVVMGSANFGLHNFVEDVKQAVRLGISLDVLTETLAVVNSQVCAEDDSIVHTKLENRARFDFTYAECLRFAYMGMQRSALQMRELFGLTSEEILDDLRETLTTKTSGDLLISSHIYKHRHEQVEPGSEKETIQ